MSTVVLILITYNNNAAESVPITRLSTRYSFVGTLSVLALFSMLLDSFHVGPSRNIIINGADVQAWSVMYTGDWYGYWHVGNTPSTGTETDTILYDKTYGAVVGWDLVGSYVYASADGSWTETDFDYFRATDSNFMQPHTTTQTGALSFLLQPNLIVEVSAAIIAIVVACLIVQGRKSGRSIARLRQVIQPLFKKHKIQSNKQEMNEEHDEA